MAERPSLLEVERAEEFSPVKNATGVDSLESSKRDQILRACRWLEQAGVRVPRKSDGSPDAAVFIGPLFALCAEDVRLRVASIPKITPGSPIALDHSFDA